MAAGLRLLRSAQLTRQQLIIFALVSAILNGMVTAGEGLALPTATLARKADSPSSCRYR